MINHPLKTFRGSQKPRLSQKQLADLLGVSRTTVARWETGTRRIGGELLHTISKQTGISKRKLRPDLAELID